MPSAWQIHSAKPTDWRSLDSIEHLRLNNDVPAPTQLEPSTALVRIQAVSLNTRDLMVVAHDPVYPGNHVEDLSPCSDGAGEVVKVGEGSVWKVGDRVAMHTNDWIEDPNVQTFEQLRGKGAGDVQGTLRQYVFLKDTHLIRAPTHLSYEETAAMGTAGGAAANALFYGPVPVGPGMTVLTQGTGGVSCFAIQLASAVGATVISTSSSDAKLEMARKIGATHTINYRTHEHWAEEVLTLTDGKGVDHVVDVGGAGTIEQSLESAKQGGLISVVGILSEPRNIDIVPALLFGGKTVRGVFATRKMMAEHLMRMAEDHGFRPVIAKSFPWSDAKEAFQALMGASEVGKIVIRV